MRRGEWCTDVCSVVPLPPEFTLGVHKIQRMFRMQHFMVIAPQTLSGRVLDMDEAAMLLKTCSTALCNLGKEFSALLVVSWVRCAHAQPGVCCMGLYSLSIWRFTCFVFNYEDEKNMFHGDKKIDVLWPAADRSSLAYVFGVVGLGYRMFYCVHDTGRSSLPSFVPVHDPKRDGYIGSVHGGWPHPSDCSK